MNVTGDVSRNCAFRPAPIGERPGKELEFAAWSWKAAFDLTVYFDAGQAPARFVTIGAGNWHNVWRSRFRGAREYASKCIFANVLEFFGRNVLFIDRADLFLDFE